MLFSAPNNDDTTKRLRSARCSSKTDRDYTMHPMLNTAIQAARAAGHIILRYSNQVETISVESKNRNDFVTEIDREAEKEIIHKLRRAYPEHGFLGEESGKSGEDSKYQWIIDPLDGTTNYLYGIPHYAISIALKVDGKLDQAVVYDPLKEELFTASKGGGAHLNNHRIRASARRSMTNALLGTGIPFREDQDINAWLAELEKLRADTAGIRRLGVASLDLAYIACGRLDGFWESGLKPWDFAAGALLIQEAGGLISDFTDHQGFWRSGNIVAGNPKVHAEMIKRIGAINNT